ncbi:MAG: hypothetical protein QM775_23935 [Pirellulales bacterium]
MRIVKRIICELLFWTATFVGGMSWLLGMLWASTSDYELLTKCLLTTVIGLSPLLLIVIGIVADRRRPRR